MIKKFLCFFAAIFVLLSLIYFTAHYPERWFLPMPQGDGEPIPVMIKEGISARQAADEFAESGVIEKGRGALLARWMVRFSIDRRLRPGLYAVRRGTPWEVARQMIEAEPKVTAITLVPGTDIYSFKELFPEEELDGDALSGLLLDDSVYPKELLGFLPNDAEGRLAFLLPETYHLSEKSSKALIYSAVMLWWRRVGINMPDKLLNSSSFEELAIIASLVEKEGFWDDERPKIAGVIQNRREKGMPLQIDATVVYAWRRKGRDINRVFYKDLELASPYNTYRIPDLPPAPICIPSERSWLAVLEPENHSYLYYVAKSDGRHLFSETYAEHQQKIKTVRAQ